MIFLPQSFILGSKSNEVIGLSLKMMLKVQHYPYESQKQCLMMFVTQHLVHSISEKVCGPMNSNTLSNQKYVHSKGRSEYIQTLTVL